MATAFAALAAGVSAIIIAFQTGATARAATATAESARETGRAADATEATVRAATRSLELAQVQQKQTLYMVSEAVKSRIDASMPRFRVLIDDDIEWPPPGSCSIRRC
jgi:dihydroorotate dehydrogenase